MATALTNITTARDNLAQCVANTTAQWLASGAPPTYSIDGESVQWESWLKSKLDEIDAMTSLMQRLSGPWTIRTYGRA